MDDISALLDELLNGPMGAPAVDRVLSAVASVAVAPNDALDQSDDEGQSAPAGELPGDPHWPGNKLRRRVEAEAKRKRRRVVWVQEEKRVNGELVEVSRYWKFEKLPTPRKKQRPACNALCRDGHNCRARVVVRKDGTLANRCRLHGGLSTGPRSESGRAAIVESNRRRAKS